jgi:hypothetical protein
LQMSETRILIRLLRMYFPRNWEFGSALSNLKPPPPYATVSRQKRKPPDDDVRTSKHVGTAEWN